MKSFSANCGEGVRHRCLSRPLVPVSCRSLHSRNGGACVGGVEGDAIAFGGGEGRAVLTPPFAEKGRDRRLRRGQPALALLGPRSRRRRAARNDGCGGGARGTARGDRRRRARRERRGRACAARARRRLARASSRGTPRRGDLRRPSAAVRCQRGRRRGPRAARRFRAAAASPTRAAHGLELARVNTC